MELINQERFEAWLFSRPRDDGFYFLCNECMIGQFLKSEGRKLQCVGYATVTFDGDDFNYPLPEWIMALQRKFIGTERMGVKFTFTFGEVQDAYTELYGKPHEESKTHDREADADRVIQPSQENRSAQCDVGGSGTLSPVAPSLDVAPTT